ncbi:glycosyltransferase [Roseomonas sp. 18066]|uniref:glycosyltransferase n=1 Tax=Roseomonas sp. 18066 TaxID=2681412 RepID=UPI001358E427|nr:glycosyltransferase [Roseomonas sp. 18066]
MALKASGERFLPEAHHGEIAVEHYHRYLFAREFAAGRDVLDIACGEGYGSALLAERAAVVTGIDIDQATILDAARRYPRRNLTFVQGDGQRIPLADASIDLVVSFETIDRLDTPEGMLAELRRVLRPGGLLILSATGDTAALLRQGFGHVALAGQRAVFGSALFFEQPVAATLSFERQGEGFAQGPGMPAASGVLAVASDAPLPPLFNGLLIEPVTDSEAVVQAEAKLRAREGELDALTESAGDAQRQLAALTRDVARLQSALSEQRRLASATGAKLEAERQRANAIETSSFWRATAPLRDFLETRPGLQRTLRRGLRALYHSRQTLRHHRVTRQRQANFQPLVTVIVPNFNHARFLPQRLDSILAQGYRNLELLVLDDASTDDSAAVIERYRQAHPDKIRVLANAQNSGNVFRQWKRGIAEARGALIWICESDDFAEPDFLENLVPVFLDESVMIGFGRIQFADRDGKPYAGLDAYRERAEPGIWGASLTRPAKTWFDNGFGVSNIIPNVGGCLIRRQPIEEPIWQEATTYRILGDWYLYAMLARGGSIAFEPQAVSYFRQHGQNTSVSSFTTAAYYTEHERLLCLLRQRWGVSDSTVRRFSDGLRRQFEHAGAAASLGSLDRVYDTENVLATPHGARHVLMVILGFYLGGGEIFPIHLANQLVREGHMVSVLALQPHDWNDGIRAQLDHRIPVYQGRALRRMGAARFLEEAGVDIVHSHFVGAEQLFFGDGHEIPDIPYVVTLHGSYEVSSVNPDFIRSVAQHVSHWVYLTRKNLDHLQVLGAAERGRISTSCIPNGMPLDPRPFPQSRAELGIGEGDLVFALVSRAMKEKGWEPAIQALASAQKRLEQQGSPRRLHLLLCGAGPEADRLKPLYAAMPNVKFLGFQDCIHGVYRLSDCAILPTRFQGESFPLTLIQAMQVARPVIASDVGEIGRMLVRDERRAGLVVAPEADDAAFAALVAEAMVAMADDATRAAFGRDAAALGESFGMETVSAAYGACYEEAIARHGMVAPPGPASWPAVA